MMEPDSKELLTQKRETESNCEMRIRKLHISYEDAIKTKARTNMCVISVLSAGVGDR